MSRSQTILDLELNGLTSCGYFNIIQLIAKNTFSSAAMFFMSVIQTEL